MSKKKFTDGLESLFTHDHNKERGTGASFLEGGTAVEEGKEATLKQVAKQRTSRKNFTTDLDSLLEEALQESFAEQMAQREATVTGSKIVAKPQLQHQQPARRRPTDGLDFLIRRTVERGAVEEDQLTGTRRLTVTFDKEKLNKLKTIARIEKAYLKDILGDIVAEYIRRYESNKGNV